MLLDQLRRIWAYLIRLYGKYYSDAAPILGAAIAYATLFSLFPLVLLGISVAGYLIASPERQQEVIQFAAAGLPASLGDAVRNNVKDIVGGRGVSGLIAAGGLLIAAIGVFGTLEYALNRIFASERPRGPILSFLIHLAMVVVLFALFFLSTLATSVRQFIGNSEVVSRLGENADSLFYSASATAVAIIVSALLFIVVFKFIPNVGLKFREIWAVALGAAVTWELAKYLFGLYLQSLARYSVVYGSIGTVIALLTWIYISATILLIGAEIISLRRESKRENKEIENS